jgi:hypothetical protein
MGEAEAGFFANKHRCGVNEMSAAQATDMGWVQEYERMLVVFDSMPRYATN